MYIDESRSCTVESPKITRTHKEHAHTHTHTWKNMCRCSLMPGLTVKRCQYSWLVMSHLDRQDYIQSEVDQFRFLWVVMAPGPVPRMSKSSWPCESPSCLEPRSCFPYQLFLKRFLFEILCASSETKPGSVSLWRSALVPTHCWGRAWLHSPQS